MAEKPAKKKGLNLVLVMVLVLVPIALVAAAVLAYSLPPTHALIVNGPLKPIFAKFGPKTASGAVTAKATPDPAAELKRLSDAVAADKASAAEKDAHIAQLQSQLDALQAAPKATPPAVAASPTPVPAEIKRVAAYWAAMDADKAAEIVRQLPGPYVQSVFAAMPADTVGEIMNALPPKTAAAVTLAGAARP